MTQFMTLKYRQDNLIERSFSPRVDMIQNFIIAIFLAYLGKIKVALLK